MKDLRMKPQLKILCCLVLFAIFIASFAGASLANYMYSKTVIMNTSDKYCLSVPASDLDYVRKNSKSMGDSNE